MNNENLLLVNSGITDSTQFEIANQEQVEQPIEKINVDAVDNGNEKIIGKEEEQLSTSRNTLSTELDESVAGTSEETEFFVSENSQTTSEKEVQAESNNNSKLVEKTVSINLTIIDFAGKPIKGLKYQIIVGKGCYKGTTDDNGRATEIKDVKAQQYFEFFVQKDDGHLASKYRGYTACEDMTLCAVSPHIKVELETEPHKGPVGVLPTVAKPVAIQAPVAPGAGQINADGKHADPAVKACRNETGNPFSVLTEKAVDWAKRNQIPTLGLWSWDDFKGESKGCTKPAVQTQPKNDSINNTNNSQKKTAAPSINKAQALTKIDIDAVKVNNINQEPPKEVMDLIAIMEEQVAWDWKAIFSGGYNSAGIKSAILNKTFKPITGKDKRKYHGRCYPSVKVGLWRAGLASGYYNDIPAKGAGKWLLEQGYKDVMNSVPDARWALPGDVIVYRYPDAVEEANRKKHESALKKYEKDKAEYESQKAEYPKRLSLWEEDITQRNSAKEGAKKHKIKHNGGADPKRPQLGSEPMPPDDENYGHIDVRTYDAYMSDFLQSVLPNANKFVVIGIYRKAFDPLPDLRLRAFLKIIREWECHEEQDDSKRYYLMLNPINGSRRFVDTSKHPHEGVNTSGTPSGAYQITLETYRDFSSPLYGIGKGFTPILQDRFVVAIMERQPGNPLALIRNGKISEAVSCLKGRWSSLPGGMHPRKEKRGNSIYTFTMDDLLQRHQAFMNELIGK